MADERNPNLPNSDQTPPPDVGSATVDVDGLLRMAQQYGADAKEYEAPISACVADIDGAVQLQHECADQLKQLTDFGAAGVDDLVRQERAKASYQSRNLDVVEQEVRSSRLKERTTAVKLNFGDRANAIATKTKADMEDLEHRLDLGRAAVGWDEAPDGSEDVATLLQLERYGEQCRYKGVEATADHYQSQCLQRDGGLVETPEAKMTRRACVRWIRDLLAEPARKRVFQSTMGGTKETRSADTIGKENRISRALLAEFERQEELQTPPQLLLSIDVYGSLLIPAYRSVIGMHAWDLSPQSWGKAMSDQGGLPDRLDVLADWAWRHLPYARPDQLHPEMSLLVLQRRGGTGGPPGWDPATKRVPITAVVGKRFAGRVR